MHALLFDFDGTLVDTLSDITFALNRLREHEGHRPISDSQARPYIGRGAEHLLRHGIPNASDLPRLLIHYRTLLCEPDSFRGAPYPDVVESLMCLKKMDFKLGIVSNKPRAALEAAIRHYFPKFQFDAVMGPENVSRRKPAPEHLLETLLQLNVARDSAWLVGDDRVDQQCANACGVSFLAASYGFGGVKDSTERTLHRFSDIWMKVDPLKGYSWKK